MSVPDELADNRMSRRQAVRETYERIADHFAKTRPTAWAEVDSFLSGRTGAIGLDLGVGNGRHAEVLAEVVDDVIGIDLSRAVLETARDRAESKEFPVTLVEADVGLLPVRSKTVDIAVYIATLHHLPSRSARIESLAELDRVLTPTGVGLISAWSVSHDRFDATVGFDTTIDWTLPDGQTVPRFYHIYDHDEFTREIESSPLRIRDRFDAAGNCYAVVTTPDSSR